MDDKLDLTSATEVRPPSAPVHAGRFIERVGHQLTLTVLIVIGVFLVVALALLVVSEYQSAERWNRFVIQQSSDSLTRVVQGQTARALNVDTVAFRVIETERAAFRAFWREILQMVLLNALLPILTALLGYVFGSRSEEKTQP